MVTRKYHLLLGLICLGVSILLPTMIYHYFMAIEGMHFFISDSFRTTLIEVTLFGVLIVLLMSWLASVFFAARELGGYMMQLGKVESELRQKMHESFHQDYLDSH